MTYTEEERKLSLHSDVVELCSHVGKEYASAVSRTLNIGRALRGFRRNLYHTAYPERDGNLYDLVMLLYAGSLPLGVSSNVVREISQSVRAGSLQHALTWLREPASQARREVDALAKSEYFLTPDKSTLAERNPYAACQVEAGCPEELQFLTQEHGFQAILVNARPGLEVEDLSEEEIVLLLHALHAENSPLAKLMRPLPFLTHQENVAVALQHARLFLLGALLPVAFAIDITYADLRHLVGPCNSFPCCQASKYQLIPAADEDVIAKWRCWKRPLFRWLDNPDRLPSGMETNLRLTTISSHLLAKKEPSMVVVHETSTGCPAEAPLFVRQLLRLRSPHCFDPTREEPRDWREWNSILVHTQEEEEEGHGDALDQATYAEWEFGESEEMFALLTRL
ncbi:hypothetical protein SELMODRAFT_408107 [Selaginella moellendorffii]|uniref:Uncharacterized protein n=1 Tax=Selaginella moellendorffii TaxID=88036 RepID=D8R777_SELML|nr:hypothetical protein SELMODRAFT_408107 [Selaginella moellendorffii]